jgi:DNA-binding transcriptional LysR family regulator
MSSILAERCPTIGADEPRSEKIQRWHHDRLAVVYVRQSTLLQVEQHPESRRRQYQLAERAQALGVRLQAKVEVELKDIALRLVAAGIGDTYLPSAYTRAPYYPDGLGTAPFEPALYDTFAIITRPGARLSPGVRELLTELETHMRGVADELDRSR